MRTISMTVLKLGLLVFVATICQSTLTPNQALAFSKKHHKRITTDALSREHFSGGAKSTIESYSIWPDQNAKSKADYHFSNCCWYLSTKLIRILLEESVVWMNMFYHEGYESYRRKAYLAFGRVAHIIQDFFAHSNWIDIRDGQFPIFYTPSAPVNGWWSARSNKNPEECGSCDDIAPPHGNCLLGVIGFNYYNFDTASCSGFSKARWHAVEATRDLVDAFEDKAYSKYPNIAQQLINLFKYRGPSPNPPPPDPPDPPNGSLPKMQMLARNRGDDKNLKTDRPQLANQ